MTMDGIVSQPPASAQSDNTEAENARSEQNFEIEAASGAASFTPVKTGSQNAEDVWRDLPSAPGDAELERLRSLLFTRELTLLERLKAYLTGRGHNVKQVSDVLAEAIAMRDAQDKSLGAALEPVVDDIIKRSLRRHQDDFVSVLFPLMGPSIRKSIAETFRSMMGSFSKSMEMAFSWRGFKWRIEAMRSGKSFGEIVMLHTLVYRVEQTFFIHSETGLVLSHLIGDGADAQDADMVSAMLTAIQDFARDCFAAGSEGELESMRLGEFTVFIEKSTHAYLACVVRGTPPAGFNAQMRAVLETLQIKYADFLAAFNGDTAPFATAPQYLEDCMIARYVDDNEKIPLWAKLMPVMLVLLLAGALVYAKYDNAKMQNVKEAALNTLRAEPGLMLISISEKDAPPWEVIILKDNLANKPEILLADQSMDLNMFAIKSIPFISYDPVLVEKRSRLAITDLPSTVHMEYDARGGLIFSGTAPMQWILKAREQAKAIPGITRVDMSALNDPLMGRILELIKDVEELSIEFVHGKDAPVKADQPKLQQAVEKLVLLENLTAPMGLSMTLTIFGHADPTGQERRNYEISRERAAVVASMLYDRGSSMPISMYGLGSKYPKQSGVAQDEQHAKDANQASRRIEMRVHLTRAAMSVTDFLRE